MGSVTVSRWMVSESSSSLGHPAGVEESPDAGKPHTSGVRLLSGNRVQGGDAGGTVVPSQGVSGLVKPGPCRRAGCINGRTRDTRREGSGDQAPGAPAERKEIRLLEGPSALRVEPGLLASFRGRGSRNSRAAARGFALRHGRCAPGSRHLAQRRGGSGFATWNVPPGTLNLGRGTGVVR